MATVHLLCGLPGAGKTSFARFLERKISSSKRLTHDEWMHLEHGSNPDKSIFFEAYTRIDQKIWSLAQELLSAGQDIIIDYGFWSLASRNKARSKAALYGAESRLYWLNTDIEICRSRVAARSKNIPSDSLFIDPPAFQKFCALFEPPMDHEQPILITDDSDSYSYQLSSDEYRRP